MDHLSFCIACDVKSSRAIKKDFVALLMEKAEYLNDTFSDDLLVPFDVRNGDELLGVVGDFPTGYKIAILLKDSLADQGVFLYIGIGLGKLESTESSIHTMNGSAVLCALDARDQFLKRNHPEARHWTVDDQHSSIFFYSKDYPYKALNALYFSMEDRIHRRSEKQKEIVRMVTENPSNTYEELGLKMGYKSPKSTVSYLLSRADFQTVRAMEESLLDLLYELQQWFKREGS